jgi:hypothetical protein
MCGKIMCPEADGCLMCNTERWSLKMYDAFQPLRDVITECPELKVPIVEALGKAFTQSFAGNFYAGG